MKILFKTAVLGTMLPLTGGELLNLNSSMELGIVGRGVPGCSYYATMLDKHQIAEFPDRIYSAETAEGGNPGRCMKIPGFRGISRYRIEFADFYIRRAGKIQISFDAKLGPGEDGQLHPDRNYSINFRCMPDQSKHSTYPLLTEMRFRPDGTWKRFTKTVSVKPYTSFYAVWVCTPDIPQGGPGNTLYLDNFRVEFLDGENEDPGEFAVIADRRDQLYEKGERILLHVRALLPEEQTSSQEGTLLLKRSNNQTVALKRPVVLQREYGEVYSGEVSLTAEEYGAFLPELRIPGRKLRGVESPVLVLHKPVIHPFGSPGRGLGLNRENDYTGSTPGEIHNFIVPDNGFERSYRLLSRIGAQTVRLWGHWRLIEYAEGKFDTGMVDPHIAMMTKYQLEPLFVVGAIMGHSSSEKIKQRTRDGKGPLPEYLLKYLGKSERKDIQPLLPPLPVFIRYLNFIVSKWGDRIRLWEIFNEPGLGYFPAEEYLKYLRASYRLLKQHDPDAVVLGNGVTGDFGMNVVQWCEKLNAADPDYTDFLDMIAFHPYRAGLDYMDGVYNRYSDCIRNIRNLTRGKPLYNTECYYLPTAYRKQVENGILKRRFGANELLRHYLDGLFHGVGGASSIDQASFWNRSQNNVDLVSLNENAAALNTLSALLKDMVFPCEKVDLGKMVRAGMFRSMDGKRAMGFLYDFRPAGSRWTPGDSGGCRILDLFGNDCSQQPEHRLKLEPYYILGSPDAVRRALAESRFKLEKEIRIIARPFGKDWYVEGLNLSGLPGEYVASLGSRRLFFPFFRNLTGRTFLLRDFQLPENVEKIASSAFTLPAEIVLDKGSRGSISEKDGKLYFTFHVKEKSLRSAPDKALWNGSCVELFFDPDPVSRLNEKNIRAYQYAFGVLPAADGTTVVAPHRKTTAATRRVTRTADGYTMNIILPLDELPFRSLYGLEIEIGNGDSRRKETLGGASGRSYRERFHYTLILIPSRELLRNGDFKASFCGIPDHWMYSMENGTLLETRDGCVTICRSAAAKRPYEITQPVFLPKGRSKLARLQFDLAFHDVKTKSSGQGRHGVSVRLLDEKGRGAQYGVDVLQRDWTGSRGWGTYLLEAPLAGGSILNISLGIGPETSGSVQFRNLLLSFE